VRFREAGISKCNSFGALGPFDFGNMPGILGWLREPGELTTNLSAIRHFKIRKDKPYDIEVRAERSTSSIIRSSSPGFLFLRRDDGDHFFHAKPSRTLQVAGKFTF
jgi:hypothetical protein